jgi:hypothetical protein
MSILWRDVLYISIGWIIFIFIYWYAADLIRGPGGHEYMYQNKETTIKIGVCIGTGLDIVAFTCALQKHLPFLYAHGIMSIQTQELRIKEVLPLWAAYFWRNWLYMFVGWIAVSSMLQIAYLFGPQTHEYFLLHPYLSKEINCGLWLTASIPALKNTLINWRPTTKPYAEHRDGV